MTRMPSQPAAPTISHSSATNRRSASGLASAREGGAVIARHRTRRQPVGGVSLVGNAIRTAILRALGNEPLRTHLLFHRQADHEPVAPNQGRV